MKYKRLLGWVVVFLSAGWLQAETSSVMTPVNDLIFFKNSAIYEVVGKDTILLTGVDSTITSSKAFYYYTIRSTSRLNLPLIFDMDLLPKDLNLRGKKRDRPHYRLQYRSYIRPKTYIESLRDSALKQVFLHRPDLIDKTSSMLPTVEIDPTLIIKEKEEQQIPLFLVDGNMPLAALETQKATISNRKWKFKGKLSLQLSENYISPNWYQGGESNIVVLALVNMSMDYHNRKNIQWENNLDFKTGFTTDISKGMTVNTDQFRLFSKFGYKAYKMLFYSTSAELQTQLINHYNGDRTAKTSSLFSPADFYLNIGMDINGKVEKKNFSYSVALSPLSYKLRFVLDPDVDTKQFGFEEGKRLKHDIGSRITAGFTWNYAYWGSWESKAYFFTNYVYTDTQWENIFNFAATKYLTTRLYVNIKYDESVQKLNPDFNNTLLQMFQSLSFGVVYFW